MTGHVVERHRMTPPDQVVRGARGSGQASLGPLEAPHLLAAAAVWAAAGEGAAAVRLLAVFRHHDHRVVIAMMVVVQPQQLPLSLQATTVHVRRHLVVLRCVAAEAWRHLQLQLRMHRQLQGALTTAVWKNQMRLWHWKHGLEDSA